MLYKMQALLYRSAMEAIKRAIPLMGGTAAAAKVIGVSPQAINQWANGVRPVPIERCYAIEQATAGAVTRRDLRPDDWESIWPEMRDVGEAA